MKYILDTKKLSIVNELSDSNCFGGYSLFYSFVQNFCLSIIDTKVLTKKVIKIKYKNSIKYFYKTLNELKIKNKFN
jgi:hypothetical protein